MDDAPALADIHAGSFSRAWSDGDIESMLAIRGTRAYVARSHGGAARKPLAFALVRQTDDEAEIITIATNPKWRRRGVGSTLMNHVIRELQRDRIGRLLLEVDEGNPAALKLYRSLGFRQIAVRHGYYPSGGAKPEAGSGSDGARRVSGDALVMELDLR